VLGAELSMWLDDAGRRAELEQEFVGLHVDLKRDANERAAQAIIDLLQRRRPAVTP
jgi:lipid A disaccharide synthetase